MKQYLLLLSLVLFTLSATKLSKVESKQKKWIEQSMTSPIRHLKTYDFNPKSELYDRVVAPSDQMIHYFSEMDGKEYSSRVPTTIEKNMITNYISRFPSLHQKLMKERLLHIYIIDGYRGGGLADWVVDNKGEMSGFIALNSALFLSNMTEWVSMRDNQGMLSDKENYTVLDLGEQYTGLMYVLLHEATHLADYVKNINPYVGYSTYCYGKYIQKKTFQDSKFVKSTWHNYSAMKPAYDFKERKQIAIYDFKKAVLSIDQIDTIWKKLVHTPFASLYGTTSWAEDLAEFVTLYHLTEVMKIPYEIRIYKKGNLAATYHPMESKVKAKRKEFVRSVFYSP